MDVTSFSLLYCLKYQTGRASGLESSVELADCDGSVLTCVSVCLSVTGLPRQ